MAPPGPGTRPVSPRAVRLPGWLLTLALLAGCGGDSTGPTDENAGSEPPRPAAIRVDAGDGQAAPVGARVPEELAVRVDDQRGQPLPGVRIEWAVIDSAGPGASLGAASSVTDADGIGTNVVHLGDALGEYVVEAMLPDLPDGSALFRLTATAAPAITGIVPDPILEGAEAVLSGRDFGPEPEHNTVLFDGREATVTAASPTELTFQVPGAGCLPARDSAVIVVELGGVQSDTFWHPAVPNEPPATALEPAEAEIRADSAGVQCVQFPAEAGPASFLVVAANATPEPGITAPERLIGRTGAATTLGAGGFAVGSAPAALRSRALERTGGARDVEARIRRFERDLFPRAAPAARSAFSDAEAKATTFAAEPPEVGDRLELKMPDVASGDLCASFDTVVAEVKAVGRHGIALEDTAAPNGGFSDADYEAIVAEFDDAIFPTDTLYFGGATDLDDNGGVILLFTPVVNELSDPDERGFVAGFFFAGDLFPVDQCESSNVGELLYMLAPDPGGEVGRDFDTEFVRELSRGTAAHELQHLINAAQRIFFVTGTTSLEEIWLSEALSHLAEEVVGHAVLGLGSGSNITFAESFLADPDAYDAFYLQNLARLAVYLEHPDSTSTQSPIDPDADLATRGAAWSLLRWALDQHTEPATEIDVTRSMVATTRIGIENLEDATGAAFEEMQPAWLLSLFADDFVEGADPRFRFTTWNFRDLYGEDPRFDGFPLAPVALEAAANSSEYGVRSGSGRFFLLELGGDSPALSLEFTAQSGAPLAETIAAPRTLLMRLP